MDLEYSHIATALVLCIDGAGEASTVIEQSRMDDVIHRVASLPMEVRQSLEWPPPVQLAVEGGDRRNRLLGRGWCRFVPPAVAFDPLEAQVWLEYVLRLENRFTIPLTTCSTSTLPCKTLLLPLRAVILCLFVLESREHSLCLPVQKL